jgi:heme exporter protein B
VALLFGSTLGLARLLGAETEAGAATALLLSPADRGALFAGKWLSGYGFSMGVAVVLLPAMIALLSIGVAPTAFLALLAVIALGLVGWVAAGVLIAAVTASTRAREVLLPVLLYPLVLPLVVPAVHAVDSVLRGSASDPGGSLGRAVLLIGAYDVAFWVLGFLLLGKVLEE